MSVRILNCDVMEGLAQLADESVDCVVTDPPYGDTSLDWDQMHAGWLPEIRRVLKRAGSMWVFGSLRSHMATDYSGWHMAQDVIWEKHNGSNSFADRFRRVHEIAAQFYRSDAKWADIYKQPIFTEGARARAVTRSKNRTQHWGAIGESKYVSVDGGPLLMRSVMYHRSCHGEAEHPTQKPVAVIAPLIEYSCPPIGVVLDPFIGSGTTAQAALQLGRACIGIEIDPEYAAMARNPVAPNAPLFEAMEAAE
jgi:site-specific DNA-methyltransferase (adenine-specific)